MVELVQAIIIRRHDALVAFARICLGKERTKNLQMSLLCSSQLPGLLSFARNPFNRKHE